ncbi:hypothetical protein F511_36987 [Dorcoceras hygrometricum]|uniref:Splicing factor 3B subunit 1-like n=1 Tax=Dorcoceras hygrometricum TaxID=472368 RepID=A0A2Z7BWZ3_9LAMI|nr:hypothetical protein F511_36987 [Dorcoceras hygrometricum]
MKYDFRLLNDILEKSITVKAGSFDFVTHERFLMMTVIHFGIKLNLSNIIFEVLKEISYIKTKRAKGFAAQICVLLKGNPAVTLGEAKTFPPLKIIAAKTVITYIATNTTIDAHGESDEPDVAKVAIVKKKSVLNNKSASIADKDADDVHVEAISKEKDLALISVAQDAAPIQVVEPISVVPSDRPHAQKRKTSKRKLSLSTGFDDEIVEKESAVEIVVVRQKGPTSVDDFDTIIEQVIAETAQLEIDLAEPFVARSDDITVEISEHSTAVTDEESMSIEDILQQISGDAMLPSVLASEPTKIIFGLGIQILGVHEVEQYKDNLPRIAATDKGKETLVVDTIQGHPAREIFSLIYADIDFLIQMREQVIEEVAAFFNSFGIRRLPTLGSLEAISAKEEKILTWGETDSVQTALQRRVYIAVKYRELLIRKFLDAIRHYFVSGTPTTAIDLNVLELLTSAHHFALKVLLRPVQVHKLEWTRPSNSQLFEGDSIDRGFFIPRNHRTIFSTCWIRAKILVDGSWLIVEGVDFWRPITRPVASRNWELLPQRHYNEDLAPLCTFIEPVQDIDSRAPFSIIVRDLWAEVCVAFVQFSLI